MHRDFADAIRGGLGRKIHRIDYDNLKPFPVRLDGTPEEMSLRCLQAVRDALERGEYWLRGSRRYAQKSRQHVLLGSIKEDMLYIRAGEVCRLYAAVVGCADPINVVGLRIWAAMTAVGLGCEKCGVHSTGGKSHAARKLDMTVIGQLLPEWDML